MAVYVQMATFSSPHICMAILYRTYKSYQCVSMAIWGSTAKFLIATNISGYTVFDPMSMLLAQTLAPLGEVVRDS